VKLVEEAIRSRPATGWNVFSANRHDHSPKNSGPRSTRASKSCFCRTHSLTRSCPATLLRGWPLWSRFMPYRESFTRAFRGRADHGGCRSSGSGERRHDSAFCGGRSARPAHFSPKAPSVRTNSKVLRGSQDSIFSPARGANLLGRTDSAPAPVRRAPGCDFLAQRNSLAASEWTLPLAIFIGNEAPVCRAICCINGRDHRDPASCASRVSQRRSRCQHRAL